MLESDAREDNFKTLEDSCWLQLPSVEVESESSWNDSFSDSCEWFESFDTAYIHLRYGSTPRRYCISEYLVLLYGSGANDYNIYGNGQ